MQQLVLLNCHRKPKTLFYQHLIDGTTVDGTNVCSNTVLPVHKNKFIR